MTENQTRLSFFQVPSAECKVQSAKDKTNSCFREFPFALCTALLPLIVVLLTPAIATAAGAQSLQSFVELKPKWPDFVGSPLRIEGHYSILVRDTLRMKNCDLSFKASQPIKLLGSSKVIEVSGRLAKEATSGKLYFEIDQIRQLPTDLQTLAEPRTSNRTRHAHAMVRTGRVGEDTR